MKLGNQLGLRTFDLASVVAYKDASQMKGLDNLLFFDKNANVLICPIRFSERDSYLVPFHVRMIKNCSMQNERNVHTLRVNFHNPNQVTKDVVLPKTENDQLFIKELTYKSSDGGKNLNSICGDIREALRIIKQ